VRLAEGFGTGFFVVVGFAVAGFFPVAAFFVVGFLAGATGFFDVGALRVTAEGICPSP